MSDDKRTIDRFLAYLRIKSVHPTPDYASANAFLSEYLASFGFEPRLIALPSGLSVLLATMKGRDSSLPSLLLTSHCDVVPVEEKSWKFDPFAAHVDTDGKIYGRGAQDMKSCTVQHIEALGRLKRSGASFLRDIHILIAPDEEIGGNRGIRSFLPMDEFKKLNVGVALDEGLANPRDAYTLFYGERTPWWVKITASGNVGHGSRFIEGAAVDKLHAVCHKFLEFRAQQKAQYDSATECGCKTLGDFTTVNLTNIKAGIGQINVVPASAEATFDIRISPAVDLEAFRRQLDQWCDVPGVKYEFVQMLPRHHISTISPNDLWWSTLSRSFAELNVKIEPEIFPAATDSRFLRELGLPAYGFSPMRKTPILLHDHNEFVDTGVLLEGVAVFEKLIANMANAQQTN